MLCSKMLMKNAFTQRTSDATTRMVWYRIGQCHDFELRTTWDWRTLRTSVLSANLLQLGVIQLWASILISQLGWLGSFEGWANDPTHRTPLAHAIRDAQLGHDGLKSFGLSTLAIRCTTGLYQWLFTIGLRTNGD